ncbi:type IV toxin-antitoxin system AbiEi family antitoxin domain-containing protein [soil metagenome]
MQRHLRTGQLAKLWPGIYSLGPTDTSTRLRGLDLRCGQPVVACLGTAAGLYGFDTENVTALHVLNPDRNLLRDRDGLVVHRREGAPLMAFRGRSATNPAWTAVEVARGLRRPRALATLDAALRSGTCERTDLLDVAVAQAGRRGIVNVRDLIPLARPGAESPMESEARLVMADAGLPEPVLQYEVIDRDGTLWRLDFAWPGHLVAVEYDGFEWHSSPEDLRRDRQKRAALQELGWRTIYVVSDDVRRRPADMVRRIGAQLERPAA